MIIERTIVDFIPLNPIDVSAYKLYQSLGPIRGIARVPIDLNMGINCGGETPNGGNWDGFCVEQWHEGWAVFANIFIWIVVIAAVILIFKRKFLPKHKPKNKISL